MKWILRNNQHFFQYKYIQNFAGYTTLKISDVNEKKDMGVVEDILN